MLLLPILRYFSSNEVSIEKLVASRSAECASLQAGSFAYPWSAAEFEALLTASSTIADAALLGARRQFAGFAVSRIALDEAEILTIAVNSAHYRCGIGTRLITHHLARVAGRGVRHLFLEVEDTNAAALALYRKMGFAQVGTRPAYYRKPDGSRANALVLRREFD